MSIGKTFVTVAAVAAAVSIAYFVLQKARAAAAARQKAGFSADTTAGAVQEVKLSIDVDAGEPVLSTR